MKKRVSTGKGRRKPARSRAVAHRSSPHAPPAALPTLKRSDPEIELQAAIAASSIPQTFVLEHRFHGERKWRFDFAWPLHKIAAEVEGGVFQRGRHNRPGGFIGDCEKYNEAQLLGWTVLRFPVHGSRRLGTHWIGPAIAALKRAFRGDA